MENGQQYLGIGMHDSLGQVLAGLLCRPSYRALCPRF